MELVWTSILSGLGPGGCWLEAGGWIWEIGSSGEGPGGEVPRGCRGSDHGLEAAGGRTIGGGNGILGPHISQPGRPLLEGAGGYH